MFRPVYRFTLVLIVMGLSACSSNSPTIESNMGVKGAPDWVNEGTQSVDSVDGRFIYGVASAPSMNDESLQTATADNRARAEVAKVVSTYVDSTMSDYTAATGDTSSNSIENSINSATQTVLNGAKIKGRWKDKNTGNVYSFAEMDMKALDDAISTAGKLSDSFKAYYSENASANFDRFIKDTEE
ncbi:hypothetical protein FT643_18275 [Ketobacter sp. MCCC 1A13808]|uniref:LPP20 family lipoprotein n=1 Tax=Ketobacter sp. MCCC 1A13808 TaxID=2602738 RepID=UPI000F11F706|nr:LPP20 family lipoprotein [Ketobacter sp. MCCC 1A13808]MVF14087.1 hypothetical protein [Ketobacter sp. MCCC 1A13808]RLP55112.1 MAG: hypothetical protein D6160_07735 [Ketobacter sp.]|tara:strand:- start:55 stop:609 length:555 start_codon:yes stop_codon:yes gene_type:complete